MRKELLLRTEVLPEELPVLFSNKSVYNNFTYKDIELLRNNDGEKEGILSINYTIPLYFNIPNGIYKTRKIGLLHPLGQLQIADYMLKYESQILAHCKKSQYSVRSPVKRNLPSLDLNKRLERKIKKINEDFLIKDKSTITSDENSIFYLSYFTYNSYKRIEELFISPRFNREKYKYNHFLKLDIQRCFPSIYTHSLSWAVMGSKSLGKLYAGEKTTFANATDRVAQKLNFNETNGLVVGPEFSRVLAEILLTYIDNNVARILHSHNLKLNSDYKIYRYVDDFFIFAHDEEKINLIKSTVTNELEKVNLTVNLDKYESQRTPFKFFDSSIIKLKRIIKDFENDKQIRHQNNILKETIKFLENDISNNKLKISEKYNSVIDTKNDWENMFERIEEIIIHYPESRGRIVKYFLTTIKKSLKFNYKVLRSNYKELKLIRTKLEIISNIYSLFIDNKSTMNFISIQLHLLHEINHFIETEKKDLPQKEQEECKKIISNINESLFENSYRVMKNNFKSIEDMCDLLVYMKLLNKQLSPQFLISILHEFKYSYFLYCSVAYYILDDNLKDVKPNFKTVSSILKKEINYLLNNFKNKGVSDDLLDAEYFYFINDFSKYPGFDEKERKSLIDSFEKQYKKFSHSKGDQSAQHKQLDVWNKITQYPYFDWKIKMEDFERKVIKKSINRKNMDNVSNFDY